MYYIKDAQYLRTDEHEGKPCAVLRVYPGAVGDPELYVYVSRSTEAPGYEIIRMVRSEAALEIDWFDNNLHQAFSELEEEQFGDRGWSEPAVQRQQFLDNLLSKEELISKLEELPSE